MDAEKLRIAREKLTRVFRYLEALNQHRNPPKRQLHEQPWSFRLRDLPEHSCIQRGSVKAASPKAKGANDESVADAGTGYILKVKRPKLTRAPEPPEGVASWIADGWDDPARTVSVEQTREESADQDEPRILRFSDDSARVAALEGWKKLHSEWAKTERPARAAMKLFETLYTLYGRI